MNDMTPDIQRRLNRVARIVDRCQRWQRLALLGAEEEDPDSSDEEVDIDWLGDENITEDDGAAPAGPRSDPSHSRYQLEPGHAQSLSDLLSSSH